MELTNLKRCLHLVIITGIALVLNTTPGYAQELQYDLYDLIEEGLRNSIPYQTDELQKMNTYSNLLSSYFDFLPSATISTSRHYFDTDSKSAGFNLSKSISLNEPTYFNWRRARIDWENARLEFDESRKATVFEIFSRYIRVLEAQKRVMIQQNNLELQEKIYEQIELLYEQQQRALIDLKTSEIALINARISLENAEIDYQRTRELLFLYLNMDDEGYDLREPAIELTDEEFEYSEPIELTIADNNLKRSSISLWQTRLDFLPSISLNYNYSHSYPGKAVTDDLFDFDRYRDSYTLSLTASYSLFNLLEHRQVYQRSKRNLLVQEMQYDYLTSSKEQEFTQLVRDWENQQRLYDLSQQRHELAGENLDMAQERFDLGIMSLLELDQATSDYLEAELDLSTRYYQLMIKQEEINLFLSRRILDRW